MRTVQTLHSTPRDRRLIARKTCPYFGFGPLANYQRSFLFRHSAGQWRRGLAGLAGLAFLPGFSLFAGRFLANY